MKRRDFITLVGGYRMSAPAVSLRDTVSAVGRSMLPDAPIWPYPEVPCETTPPTEG